MFYNRELNTQCPKAYNEVMNMIKTNVTTLKYSADHGNSQQVTFNRTDFSQSYDLNMNKNYYGILYCLYSFRKKYFC